MKWIIQHLQQLATMNQFVYNNQNMWIMCFKYAYVCSSFSQIVQVLELNKIHHWSFPVRPSVHSVLANWHMFRECIKKSVDLVSENNQWYNYSTIIEVV